MQGSRMTIRQFFQRDGAREHWLSPGVAASSGVQAREEMKLHTATPLMLALSVSGSIWHV